MEKFDGFIADFKRGSYESFFKNEGTIKGEHILVADMVLDIDYEYYGGLEEGVLEEMERQYVNDFCLRHFLQINRYMESISKKCGKNIDFIYFKKCHYYFYFEGLREELKKCFYNKEWFEFPTENSMICKPTISAYCGVDFFELMAAAYNYELETGNEVKSISFTKDIEMEV